MHRFYLPIAFAVSLFLDDFGLAEQETSIELQPVVVTASKIEEPVSEVPVSAEVVPSDRIKERQAYTLDEALRETSGLTILSHGGADPWSIIKIGGTESDQSLVMVDGVKINSVYDQKPNAGALLLNNAERIEVVKGSYSALYGSEAIGGVINIITSERPGLTYSINGGTYRTSDASLVYSSRYHDAVYTLGYENLTTEGFKFSGPYWNNTFLGKVSLPLGPTSSLKLSTYYWDWRKYDRNIGAEIKGFDFTTRVPQSLIIVLDQDSNKQEDNWLSSIQYAQAPLTWWDYNIRLTRQITHFRWSNPLDSASADRPFPLEVDSDIHSSRNVFDMQHNLYYGDGNMASIGFQYTGEDIKKEEFGNLDSFGLGPSSEQPAVDATRASRAIYLQYLFKIKELFSLTTGARVEDGPGFNNEVIPKVSALYVLPVTNTRVHISYGRGIRAPSLEDLYHPAWGNSDLRPEEGDNLEAGFEQAFGDGKALFKAATFSVQLKNLIDQDPTTFKLANIGRAKIRGGEANLHWAITKSMDSHIGYTRLITENLDSGEELPFRPHARWTWDIRYKSSDRLVLDLNGEIVGESFNPLPPVPVIGVDGKPLSEKVASYSVVNMAAAYPIVKKGDPSLGSLDFTLKIDNLFGEKYDELPTFQNYGFTFLAGIRAIY